MVVSRARVHRKQLVSYSKRRFTPGFDFVRLGQSEAELAQADQDARCHMVARAMERRPVLAVGSWWLEFMR